MVIPVTPTLTSVIVAVPKTVLSALLVAVMVTGPPAATAVTTPSKTVAIALEELVHVTVLSVVPAGSNVGTSVTVSPTSNVAVVAGANVIEVGKTVGSVTVTVIFCDIVALSVDLAVMVQVPALTPVTTPSTTVAIADLSTVHDIVFTEAFAGAISAVNVSGVPTTTFKGDGVTVIPVTAIFVTVTVILPIIVVTAELVAEITTEPAATPVTVPSTATVAIAVLADVHLIPVSVTPVGAKVGISKEVCPTTTDAVVGLKVIDVGLTFGAGTVTV